jgi:hypothetical protein
VVSDNGSELTSKAILTGPITAASNGTTSRRANLCRAPGRLRDEFLNEILFTSTAPGPRLLARRLERRKTTFAARMKNAV